MKDQLFLLNPGFTDDTGQGPFYCGDSVSVEGLLSFFPALRSKVDVVYIGFTKPRAEVVSLIGAENQSIPVLVLDGPVAPDDVQFNVKVASGKRFINTEADIRSYLSTRHRVATAK